MSRWAPRLANSLFLDLFAGSGIVGLEAASRGAAGVFFIEQSSRVGDALLSSCAAFDLPEERVLLRPLPAALERLPSSWPSAFDLVFADPPYEYDAYDDLLRGTVRRIDGAGEVAVEHSSRVSIPAELEGLERLGVRRYGESTLSFYRSVRSAPARRAPRAALEGEGA